MNGKPDVLSSGPRERWRDRGWWPWPAGGPVPVIALGLLLACLAGLGYLALQVTHRDHTIDGLRAALRGPHRHPAPAAAAGPGLPVYSSSAISTFPDKSGGSFSMVAAAVHPHPGSAPLTWLFVYGRHAKPGERYGLLGGTCGGGENIVSSEWADGTADRRGDLTIVAANLSVGPRDPNVWVLVYRWGDGITLGGIRGPFVGGGARPFLANPPCQVG
jgi:hypothetical protein